MKLKSLVVAVVLILGLLMSTPAQATSSWRYFVKICFPLNSASASEEDLTQWRSAVVGKTLAASYRNLGWEVYNVFVYRVYLHLPNIGDPSYTCEQVFDGTIGPASGWDGVASRAPGQSKADWLQFPQRLGKAASLVRYTSLSTVVHASSVMRGGLANRLVR
jgi:hypothetical protein